MCIRDRICFRARRGLPLPPTQTMNSIINGVMARTQRNDKVTLCHYTWMSNHPHFIVVSKDAQQLVNFCMELQRKLTEAIKRLLGLDYLNLWEGTPTIAKIPNLSTVKDRIAYCYCNPSEANLVDTIDEYPGVSSWNYFNDSESKVEAKLTSRFTWIRPRAMEKLPSPSLSRHQDKFFAKKFKDKSKRQFDLKVEPNAWMKRFGVKEESDVAAINESIKADIRQRELLSQERRAKTNKRAMGAHRLAAEAIMKLHIPKKKSRKIFVICNDKDLRISIIKEHAHFTQIRKERFEQWKLGDYSSPWPPGAFRPPMPPLANALNFEGIGGFNF